jgi:biofilm PGA synthesis protein PgaA
MTTLRKFAQFTTNSIRYFVSAIGLAAILCHATANATGTKAVSARSWMAEKDAAVLLARKGNTAAALVVLERLRREHPADLGAARDLVVVSTWARRDAEAVRLFVALKQGPQPDYVMEAAALAYRRLGQPATALAIYREGLKRSPNNVAFAAGEIRSMADLGETAAAIMLANADLKTRGERRDVLLAAGYAASAQKNPVEALRYIDRAVTLDPAGRETRHDRIMAIDEMGAPQIARRLADENPGVLTDAEVRQIDGDAAAALVRWGVFEPPSEELRFAASDRAIAALDDLIARWPREGDDARRDLLRARFDRMVALRDRVRMADVVAEYIDLGRQGVEIPGYALVAASDAYLYLRQPETARDLYLRGLAVDPRNPETRLALFYAYVDLEDFDAAYRQADSMAGD